MKTIDDYKKKFLGYMTPDQLAEVEVTSAGFVYKGALLAAVSGLEELINKEPVPVKQAEIPVVKEDPIPEEPVQEEEVGQDPPVEEAVEEEVEVVEEKPKPAPKKKAPAKKKATK